MSCIYPRPPRHADTFRRGQKQCPRVIGFCMAKLAKMEFHQGPHRHSAEHLDKQLTIGNRDEHRGEFVGLRRRARESGSVAPHCNPRRKASLVGHGSTLGWQMKSRRRQPIMEAQQAGRGMLLLESIKSLQQKTDSSSNPRERVTLHDY